MTGRVDVVTVPKPWGHERIWARTDRYVGKILHINAGHALSIQYHNRKDETVLLLSGELRYWVGDPITTAQDREASIVPQAPRLPELSDVRLRVGDAFRISPGTVHYMEAITDCEVLEVSTPELDDVVRLKDRYGREGTNAP